MGAQLGLIRRHWVIFTFENWAKANPQFRYTHLRSLEHTIDYESLYRQTRNLQASHLNLDWLTFLMETFVVKRIASAVPYV